MSAIDTTTNAALLQRGFMGGMDQYQQDRRLQLAQEQQALDEIRTLARIRAEDETLRMQEQDRVLRAQRYAAQRKALANLHRGLQQYGASPNEPMFGMSNDPVSFTGTLGGQPAQATQGTLPEQAMGPLDTMDVETFSELPDGLRSRLVGDQMEIAKNFRAAKRRADYLRAKGMLPHASPEELKSLADWGLLDGIPDNELSDEAKAAAVLGDEATRPTLLDYLAMDDAGVIDPRRRRVMAGLTTPQLREMQQRKMAADEKRAAAAGVENKRRDQLAQLQAKPWFQNLPPERQYAAEQDVLAGRDVSLDSLTMPTPRESTPGAMGSTSLMIGEDRVSLPTGRGQALAWNPNDPVVRSFINAAEMATPPENLPGTALGRFLGPMAGGTSSESVEKYKAERQASIEQMAKSLAQRSGWIIGGGGRTSRHVNATFPTAGMGFDEEGFRAAADSGAFDQDIATMAEQGLSDEEIEQRLRQMHSQNRGQ